tara:strand:+ start:1963 stop:4074 length:2112 start_codon:yes stop_codon:yes gene_type:complete
MTLDYNIWLILLSFIATGASIFTAFRFMDFISQPIANTTTKITNAIHMSLPIIAGTFIWANHVFTLLSTHTNTSLSTTWPLLFSWLFSIIMAFCFITIAINLPPKARHFIIGGILGGLCNAGLFYTSYIATTHSQGMLFNQLMTVVATALSIAAASVILMLAYWLTSYSGKRDTPIKLALATGVSGIILSIHFIFHTAFFSGRSLNNLEIISPAVTLSLLSLLMMVFIFLLLYERYGNNVFKLAGIFRPISANKVDKNSLSDSLTKLPNRRAFESHLRSAEKRCVRNGGSFAVVYIDLDAFKPINDTYGHHIGDTVLAMTADRLNAAIRGCDFVARIGGDEFIAILEEILSEDDIRPVVTRIVTSIKEPYLIEHLSIELSCSAGIAIYPKDNQGKKLLVNADAAMYKAKDQGKNQYKFYDEAIESANVLMQKLQLDLTNAVKNKEFSIVYMPKINCKTMAAVGAEALIRWDHPAKGEILPNDFLGVAEQCGLIKEINDWVVDECCRALVRSREVGLNLNISINLSSYQFRDPDLVQQTVDTIKNYDLPPSCLSFEIKETAAVNNQKQFKHLLSTFKQAGISVVLDDFGLLPVSLTYLLELDIDEIKIDHSFIKLVNKDKDTKALIDALFKLTHALGLKVTAEGIETKPQRDAIIKLDCDFMQGYYFTKPVKEYDLLVLYKKIQYKQLQIDFEPPIPKIKKAKN